MLYMLMDTRDASAVHYVRRGPSMYRDIPGQALATVVMVIMNQVLSPVCFWNVTSVTTWFVICRGLAPRCVYCSITELPFGQVDWE